MDVYLEHGPSMAIRAAGIPDTLENLENTGKLLGQIKQIAGWAPRPEEVAGGPPLRSTGVPVCRTGAPRPEEVAGGPPLRSTGAPVFRTGEPSPQEVEAAAAA
eukprot:2729126-Alexandrium_andersonii.AAC.1